MSRPQPAAPEAGAPDLVRELMAGVAYLTDGEGSHPGPGQALAAVRRAKAVRAPDTKPIRLGQRRAAPQAHRSRLTPRFGAGLRLPWERRRLCFRPDLWERA